MSIDRNVRWRRGAAPTRAAIEDALRRYFGAAGTVAWDPATARWYVTLAGAPSDPGRAAAALPEARWIEVFPDDDYADVITRQADALTRAVADGCAAALARLWGRDPRAFDRPAR